MHGDDRERHYHNATELYQAGQYSKALAIFEELAHDRPNSKRVQYSRGLCHVALGELKEARRMCNTLARHRGSTAGKLTAKLEEKLAKKEKETQERRAKEQRENGAAPQQQTPEPESSFSLTFVVALLVLLVVTAGAFYGISTVRRRARQRAMPPPVPATRVADGAQVEIDLFCLAKRGAPLGFAVALTPPAGDVSAASNVADDRVGSPVAANWDTLKEQARTALRMAGNRGEAVGEMDRGDMVRTLIVPRQGDGLPGQWASREVTCFTPGAATALDATRATCGKPSTVEKPSDLLRAVGVHGPTFWWGTLGLAANEDGAITHILFRASPLG